VKSLAQTVLRMTSPGMPDLYQGTDYWDFSMVDPDNRRPVDYAVRQQSLEGTVPVMSLQGWQQGRLKQQVICNTLALLAKQPDLFSSGEYLPLTIEGPLADRAIAFARRCKQQVVIVIATRLPYQLLEQSDAPAISSQVWKDTAVNLAELPEQNWKDTLTGETTLAADARILLSDALRLLPVAILEHE
jgi:(1->4)-alpha-D-glucan 1-alpha-D-glucosylmutase